MASSIPPAAETGNRRTLMGLQNHLSQLIDKCQKLSSQPFPDYITLDIRVKAAVAKFEQIKRLSETYLTEMAKADLNKEEHLDIIAESAIYEDTIQDQLDPLIKLVSQTVGQPHVSSSNQVGTSTVPHSEAELPKVNLPYFEGKDEDEWDAFWIAFDAIIHSKASLRKATKFQYLQGQLRGEARQVIANLSLTDDDYDLAIQLLHDNYSDKETAIARLSYKLMDLPSPDTTYESLQSFRLSIESIIKALSTKVAADSAEWLIKLIIQRKLPNEIIDSLCSHYNTNILSLKQIFDGLRAHVRRLRSRGKLRAQNKSTKHESSDKNKTVQSFNQKPKPQNSSSTKWKHSNVGSYSVSPTVNSTVGNQAPKPVKTKGATSVHKCLLCQGAHTVYLCTIYADRASRINRLKSLNRCIRCLRKHDSSECNTQLQTCHYCHKSVHHTALCGDINTQARSQTTNNQPTSRAKPEEENSSPAVQFCKVLSDVNALVAKTITTATLPTAQLHLINQGACIQTRGMFDQGSQRTFISKKAAEDLQLKSFNEVSISISGFLTNSGPQTYQEVKLKVCLGTYQKTVIAILVDKVPTDLKVTGLGATVKFLTEKGIKLADPLIDSDHIGDIGILIGADYYHHFILGSQKFMGMNLLQSAGGLLMSGPVLDLEPSTPERSHHTETVIVAWLGNEQSPLTIPHIIDAGLESVPKLWELDAIGIIPEQPSPDDICTYNQYLETVQYHDGQYWVRLPWKLNHKTLPTNYNIAYSQFKSLLSRLKKKPEHLKLYHEIISQQLQNKFIEVVKHDNKQTGHYLPHMAVIKESKTTPLRIVFNCSSKSGPQGTSLNDCLQTGPSLTQKLYDILLKFRLNKYAYTADISKAFLRVGLQEEDRDFTKFLWVEDPEDVNSPIVTYRFSSVLFGATSSPFLLQATLDTHLQKSSSLYKAEISQNLYVDNFQGTVNSTTELLQIYQEANKELQGANMPLQSWASNNATLNNQIERDYPGYLVPQAQKVLGIGWDLVSDTISIKSVPVNHCIVTKRDLLSQVSKVFDPLGLLTPLTIKWRLLVQEAWKTEVSWDDPLPPQLQKAWMEVAHEQTLVEQIIFPRHIVEENEEVTLHVFADSSARAFGACAYLVTSHQSCLITSKARVAPLKKRTLPQMELTALLTGTRLAVHIKQLLSTMNIKDVIIWTDNEAVLQWVRNDNCQIPYVRNRVSEIRKISADFQLLHVPTKDNPADLLSRGMTFKQLSKADIWFHGPRWLVNGSWPEQKPHVIVTQAITTTRQQVQTSVLDCTRYSSLTKLIRVTQNVFHYLRKRGIKHTFPEPLIYWVRQAQRESYGNDYEHVPPKLIHDLGLWIDLNNHNILRCGGRLKHADINLDTVHPWLLPKKHWITRLIVLHTHQQIIKHGGVLDTLTHLRQQYWIPQGRQSVKSILKDCMICRRYDARTCPYPGPPPLPKERVVHLHPFETTGVDYTGAIYLTGTADKQPIKAYICLFTCATTRAVHLEVTPDMTAQSFIQAFRRFAARRSCPKLMISDNGANLVAGEACLREICSHPAVSSTLEQRHCRWKFIPPRAPWHGGFYERLIGTVKRSLRKSLHRQRINLEELQTVVVEIESRVNNRPLTYLSDDPTQHEPLSPAHLMYGRPLTPVPSLVDDEIRDPSYVGQSELVQGYKYLSSIIQKWNDVWTKEYLTSLREHHYGANIPHNKANLQPGDIVLVDCDGPRAEWPLGKVVSVHPDSQGVLRIVKILSKGTTSLKTLDKLIHMESVSQLPSDPGRPPESLTPDDPQTPNRHIRPLRTAAQKCKENLRLHYQSESE